MTRPDRDLTDIELTMYLDGEASAELSAEIEERIKVDPILAQRLTSLEISITILQRAFDPQLLDAPAAPDSLNDVPQPSAVRVLGPVAALVASFALGIVVSDALDQGPPDWVEAVAAYQALYVTDTLNLPGQSAERTAHVMEWAQQELGVDLRPALEIEGLTFKRAQKLAFEGAPLLQMAYLDSNGVPFAFCVTLADEGARLPVAEMSHDLAVSAWTRDGVGYVLVGGADEPRVARLSKGLVTRL